MLAAPQQVLGFCFEEAEKAYGVPAELLRAVARVESGLRVLPPNMNPNGTWDIGVMRINSSWLPMLGRYGITQARLERDHCLSVMVGAWVLASNKASLGPSWDAVGAYNVGCARLNAVECRRRRQAYAWRVFCAWSRDLRREHPNCTSPPARVDGRQGRP